MLYMVIERFRHGPARVYERAAAQGRMLPAGLRYVDSWVEANRHDVCFQLMETDDPARLQEWASNWDDLVEFEFIPVVSSAEAAASHAPPARA